MEADIVMLVSLALLFFKKPWSTKDSQHPCGQLFDL